MEDSEVRVGYKDSGEVLKKKVLAEIVSILAPPRVEDDEFTVTDFAEEAGLTRRKAYNVLMAAASDGLLSKRKVVENRNRTWAFKPIGDLAKTLKEILPQ